MKCEQKGGHKHGVKGSISTAFARGHHHSVAKGLLQGSFTAIIVPCHSLICSLTWALVVPTANFLSR